MNMGALERDGHVLAVIQPRDLWGETEETRETLRTSGVAASFELESGSSLLQPRRGGGARGEIGETGGGNERQRGDEKKLKNGVRR